MKPVNMPPGFGAPAADPLKCCGNCRWWIDYFSMYEGDPAEPTDVGECQHPDYSVGHGTRDGDGCDAFETIRYPFIPASEEIA